MKGRGKIEADRLVTSIAIPTSLGGNGEGADPKTLLIASAVACYSMTLVAIVENRKLPIAGLTLESEGSDPKEAGFNVGHPI